MSGSVSEFVPYGAADRVVATHVPGFLANGADGFVTAETTLPEASGEAEQEGTFDFLKHRYHPVLRRRYFGHRKVNFLRAQRAQDRQGTDRTGYFSYFAPAKPNALTPTINKFSPKLGRKLTSMPHHSWHGDTSAEGVVHA